MQLRIVFSHLSNIAKPGKLWVTKSHANIAVRRKW